MSASAKYKLTLRRFGALGVEETAGREEADEIDAQTVLHILMVHLLAVCPGDRVELTVEGL